MMKSSPEYGATHITESVDGYLYVIKHCDSMKIVLDILIKRKCPKPPTNSCGYHTYKIGRMVT